MILKLNHGPHLFVKLRAVLATNNNLMLTVVKQIEKNKIEMLRIMLVAQPLQILHNNITNVL